MARSTLRRTCLNWDSRAKDRLPTVFEMIPDRLGREVGFEPLLDELLVIFDPDWATPANYVGAPQFDRCEVKRLRVSVAGRWDPDLTRRHADMVIRAAMHDRCRSGIRQLIEPLLEVLGSRAVQEALVDYIRTGTDEEKVGATMAWYWAVVLTQSRLRNGSEPRSDIRVILDDLQSQFQTACLAAFLATEDPGFRQDLSLCFTLDPTHYPADVHPDPERARQVVAAEPERFRRILVTAPDSPEGN